MKLQIGIIADDLTGANDSGVQLTKKGIPTSVLFDIPQISNRLNHGLVIDTNSRALTKEEAISITTQAGEYLKKSGFTTIYKKMDSTLRGHIGTELQALDNVFNPEFIFIAPAFPSLGRTTKDGIHYVNGVKLADTETAKDPKHPVKNSSIQALIEEEIGVSVGLIRQEDLHADQDSFSKKIESFKAQGISYLVCDAETLEELREGAKKMSSVSGDVIWAGSAGLAEVIPETLGLQSEVGEQVERKVTHVMTVCGSLSQVTQKQVQYAANQPQIEAVEIDPTIFFSDEWEYARQTYIERCLEGFAKEKDVVLYVPSDERARGDVKAIGTKLNLTKNAIGERISNGIGEIVEQVALKNRDLSGFVLTGGDTAKDTSRHLGGLGFQLIQEVETGIPLGTLIGPEKDYLVITKAGAFGTEASIHHAMLELKGVHNHV
ncbi:four-carbon acid sugar kinase family protein [Allobacillus sp. GCM10007491]|uniref:Four-carbon acid sugar kinase family protein n=1 Tax=Allobacillus saliphilus TaxID=2912308 RepID=A0A941CWD3_9BACI|nr:four-carbon acid sugar kinase family protein [Allobacillus saliphilus]MBR7554391.1 four-carbon acid sugar kinase family protein [Allobacillus saliphilus]